MQPARNSIDSTDLSKLPSPPAVVLELLQAFSDEDIEFGVLARICSQDAALTTRMLAVANSAAFRRHSHPLTSLDRVLVMLGTEMVKTIALITSVIQSFEDLAGIPESELRGYWRHALVCAHLAKRLAQTTGYPRPDEAYLSGLLHDVGKLVIASQRGEGYAQVRSVATTPGAFLARERELFQTDHCQIGAALMSAWRLRSFLADAVRYHHESAETLREAHPLVRLVHVANALDSEVWEEDRAFAAGDILFGLTPALLRGLRDVSRAMVTELSGPLGIAAEDTEADRPPTASRGPSQAADRLRSELRDTVLVEGLRGHLDAQAGESALLEAIARCVTLLFGVERTRFFLPTEDHRLRGMDPSEPDESFNQLECASDGAATLVGHAYREGVITHTTAETVDLGVFDRQVAGAGGAMLLLPLIHAGRRLAVAVLEASEDQLPRLLARSRLLSLFGAEAGRSMAELRARVERQQEEWAERQLLEGGRFQQVLHEVNNPLSIARNYLDLLGQQLAADTEAGTHLQVLREELERVGNILVRLTDDEQETSGRSPCDDLCGRVRRLAGLLDHALCRPRGIQLVVRCADSVPPVAMDSDTLKQVLANLVRNAAEALTDGGRIQVTVQTAVNVQGRTYVELSVSDDGPGIPPNLVSKLFQPVTTTKPGHGGMGLAIVRNLVGSADGLVSYRAPGGGGSRFQVLLPPATPPQAQEDR